MGAAPKYLFDRSFAENASPPEAVVAARLEADHRRALEAARREAFAEGEAMGRHAASADLEGEIATALDTLLNTSHTLAEQAQRQASRLRTESAALAVTAASRLAGELLRRSPTAEIEALFRDCLTHLDAEPAVTVRVPRYLASALDTRLTRIAAERSYAGRVAVVGEDGMEPGDCRIEWSDGGAKRDWRKLLSAIEAAVRRHLLISEKTSATEPGAAA